MPSKILVVDDEPDLESIIRQRFRRQIRKNEYEFAFAQNGVEALEILKNDVNIDLVMTDINMPVMDGLTLLSNRRIHIPAMPFGCRLGARDMDNIRIAMNRGAFDFLTKPIDLEDLDITIRKTLQLVSVLKERIELQAQKEKAQEEALELERKNRFIRETFGCFLTDDVVDTLLESPEGLKLGGEMREVTILMSDLRGFSSMSEGLGPDQVVHIINRYLEEMVNVILEFGGTIDEFIGDAILVIFGAPISTEDHAEKAVACALAMQNAMSVVNAANLRDGLPTLEMGIGVNTGEVVVGNIGSPKRMKYGVVGSHVNLAARIESCTIGGQLLISETTFKQVESTAKIREKMLITAKGFKETVNIYDVKGIESYNIFLSDEESPLSALKEGLPLEYVELQGKQLNDTYFKGEMIQLSEKGGIIQSLHPVPPLSTIKIGFTALNDQNISGDLYAKVVNKETENDQNFYVHFTAIPPEVKSFFEDILK